MRVDITRALRRTYTEVKRESKGDGEKKIEPLFAKCHYIPEVLFVYYGCIPVYGFL